MVSYSEWRNDSVPFWKQVAYKTTNSDSTNYISEGTSDGDWQVAGQLAWNGTAYLTAGQQSAGYNEMTFNYNADVTPKAVVDWTQSWLPITRMDSAVDTGHLSPGADSGPNVIGVEWENSPTPLQQRITVTLGASTQGPASDEVVPGLGLTVCRRGGPGQDTWLTADEMALTAMTNATMVPQSVTDRPTITVPLSDDAEAEMFLSLVDGWTLTQTAPANDTGFAKSSAPFTVTWEGYYAPQYRLIYSTARRPAYNRIVQRGNDGLGASGGRRIVQTRTIQSTNRRGSAIR